MGLEKKVREAQLNVLIKYGVLADFSGVEESVLDRAIKGSVPAGAAQDLTFAAWHDQLLGPIERVPVARFHGDVAGQTRFSNLTDGDGLAKAVKARDKQAQNSLKAAQAEIAKLQAELATLRQRAALCENVSEDAGRLRDWYSLVTPDLHRILWDVKEIQGAIFDHQGKLNRDFRQQLVKIILNALVDLELRGFCVDVELRDDSPRKEKSPTIVLHRSQPSGEDARQREGFNFTVPGVQPDVLEAASELIWPRPVLPPVDSQIRYTCYVNIGVHPQALVGEDDIFHLSCFMHKLFEAMARSGDHRPRGALREKVILCLLLAFTAPCMPARLRRQKLPGLKEIHFSDQVNRAMQDSKDDSNASSGKIVEYLLRVMHA